MTMDTQVARNRLKEVLPELTRPFDPVDIKWRVQSFNQKSGKALLVPYLDARHIQERLDEVVPGEWELIFDRSDLQGDAYIGGHVVYATLIICGVKRQDVGSSFIPNDKNTFVDSETGKYARIDANKIDPKTATSDSIKRVAAQFGIGRYLWNMDKPVFINAVDSKNQNKFKWQAPKYDDVDKQYHDYLYDLGLKGHVNERYSKVDVMNYVLKQITSGAVEADTMIELFNNKGEEIWNSLLVRMAKEGI